MEGNNILNFLALGHEALRNGKCCSLYLHVSPSDWPFHLPFLLTRNLWLLPFLPECVFTPFFESIVKLPSRSDLLLGQAFTRTCWIPFAESNLTTQGAQLIHRDFCASRQPVLQSSWEFWICYLIHTYTEFEYLVCKSDILFRNGNCGLSLCISCCHVFRLMCQIVFWPEKEVHMISSLCLWEGPKQKYIASSHGCSAWKIPVGSQAGSPLAVWRAFPIWEGLIDSILEGRLIRAYIGVYCMRTLCFPDHFHLVSVGMES